MFVVTAQHERDDIIHVFGPFKTDSHACRFITRQRQQDDEDQWLYSYTILTNPKDAP